MEFRNRPKSNYLLSAEWQELHALTLHWQSDMLFFGDELRFMDLLMDRYFTLLVNEEHITTTKGVAAELTQVKAKYDFLVKQVTKHLHHIENVMMNAIVTDSSNFRNEHTMLEDDLAEFGKIFRKVKLDTFQMAERIVKSEKEKHLIGS